MVNFFKVMSLGFDAVAMVSAIEQKQPQQFSFALAALLTDLGDAAKIKELDAEFIQSITPELSALTAKIFTKLQG